MSRPVADRIERSIVIQAPRGRVWRALTDASQFGAWFGVEVHGAFVPGAQARGRVTNKGYEGVLLAFTVERMEPETLFSWRWHPHAVEPGIDYSAEPPTLVEFTLEDVPEGTRLTVVESGFERIPPGAPGQGLRHERRRLGHPGAGHPWLPRVGPASVPGATDSPRWRRCSRPWGTGPGSGCWHAWMRSGAALRPNACLGQPWRLR